VWVGGGGGGGGGGGVGVHLNAEAEEDDDFVAKNDLSPNITTALSFSPGLCFLASSYFQPF